MSAGMWYINDLISEQNEIVPFDTWKKRGLCENDYLKWRGIVEIYKKKYKNVTPVSSNLCITFLNYEKPVNVMSTKDFYWIYNNYNCNLNSSNKIVLSLQYNIPKDEWPHIFTLPARCTIDQKLREFQYRVIHNMLWLNNKLFKIGKVEYPHCLYCKKYDENRIHLFYTCEHVRKLWIDITNWWNNVTKMGISLTEKDVLLGYSPTSCTLENLYMLLNLIILLAKHYIYVTRCWAVSPVITFGTFLIKLKNMEKYEKLYFSNINKPHIYFKKWNIIGQYLHN